MLPRNIRVRFGPLSEVKSFPFHRVLESWLMAEFKPRKCRTALEKILAENRFPSDWIDASAIQRGGFVATKAIRFPKTGSWRLKIRGTGKSQSGQASCFPNSSAFQVATMLRKAMHTNDPELIRSEFAQFKSLVKSLDSETVVPAVSQTWTDIKTSGIYRREHASLLIRSETTSVLLDPTAMLFPESQVLLINKKIHDLAAVLITHGHEDHWDLTSILREVKSPQIPVYVPKVSKTSILNVFNFEDVLGHVGQKCRALSWGETVKIGDITVRTYPFYGEQPTREGPGPDAGIRNWGNCYRFDTHRFSAMILVDSGQDPDGRMIDVVQKSVRDHGPIDVVISCLRTFNSPFFVGLPHYWSVLPFSRLQELFADYRVGRLGNTTSGPREIAEICAAVKPRYFLPYAHGFEGPGQAIKDIGWGIGESSEKKILASTQAAFNSLKVSTKIVPWKAGDSAIFGRGGMKIVPFS